MRLFLLARLVHSLVHSLAPALPVRRAPRAALSAVDSIAGRSARVFLVVVAFLAKQGGC